jgi:hypothetical protein
MRRFMLVLISMVVLLFPTPSGAQGNIHLSLVSIDIWPEYDRPDVLKIYRITLAPATILPVDLSIRIPADVQINAVAALDPSLGLINTPYDAVLQGSWMELKLSARSSFVQVEYYEPLVTDGIKRFVSFDWAGGYSVDQLEVNFLRPQGAENVSISYIPVISSLGKDGLMNYHFQSTNLAAGQSFSITINYDRRTDDLSISSLPVEAASPPGSDTPGRVSAAGILPWVLGGMGIILIITGIAWFSSGKRDPKKLIPIKSQIPEKNKEIRNHCPQCGSQVGTVDIFCRSCGTRLN